MSTFKEHLIGVIGGAVLIGSSIAISWAKVDQPIYAGITLAGALGAVGILVATARTIRGFAGWVYVIVVAARSGQQVAKLPEGLETEKEEPQPETKLEGPVTVIQGTPIKKEEVKDAGNVEGK